MAAVPEMIPAALGVVVEKAQPGSEAHQQGGHDECGAAACDPQNSFAHLSFPLLFSPRRHIAEIQTITTAAADAANQKSVERPALITHPW
jgi:hypothetical protein